MTTQEIIDRLRGLAAILDYVPVREMLAAADRLEELRRENEGLLNEMDRLRAGWGNAIEVIGKLEDHIADLKAVDKKPLNEEMVKLISGMNEANAAQVKPEPSRLEIAAMLKAGWFANRDSDFNATDHKWWIEQADALIAAAKDAK